MRDTVNAFVPGIEVHVPGRADGPLVGLTFAAKDLFDVAGYPTGGGNDDWARAQPIPDRHAFAVQKLLDAGATLVGKTITDEVSLGILGENPFHGTPVNVRAPGRVPGGSSSGSAAAVAAGLCDTAIGTDTGGSVRVPASFCGLYGIRPTHARLSLAGMAQQAPSSDTTGWFARDAEPFARVSAVLLEERIPEPRLRRLVVATDAFAFADQAVADALGPAVERLATLIGGRHDEPLAPAGLVAWSRAQRTLQPVEAWRTFEPWINRDNPRLAFSVARGMVQAAMTSAADLEWAGLVRHEARARMRQLLQPGTVVCLPTTPFPAPATGLPLDRQSELRARISCLCSHGGLTGVPQVSLPLGEVDGAPVGLSILTRRGDDALLVGLAWALAQTLA